MPVPDHEHHTPETLVAIARGMGMIANIATDVPTALADITAAADPAEPPIVLVLGSLYLAGEVLAANDEAPS